MASILASVFGQAGGAAIAQPIEAVGNVIDKLFTSDDEKLSRAETMARLAQAPQLAQVEIGKLEAQHRSIFVAGGRPFIIWVCGAALASYYLPQYLIASFLWARQCLLDNQLQPFPISNISGITELVVAILGLGVYRTFEKATGRAK